MFDVSVGDRKSIWTTTEYAAGQCPKVGRLEYDPLYKAFFRFVKQTGATALTEKLVAVSAATGLSAFEVELAGTTDALENFAGVRVPGATSMTQNTYGWLQVSGPATFLHSGGAATVARQSIQTSASVAGKVEGRTGDYTGALGAFAVAEAAKTTLDEEVKANIFKSVLR